MPPTHKRKSGRPAKPLSRADIVTAAAPVFAERGLDAVSTREVAELAGIRKASLFHHFPTKQALYDAVLEASLSGLLERVMAARLDEGDFLERLDRLGSVIVDLLVERPHSARLLAHELISSGPWLRGGGAAQVQQTLELTAAFLDSGIKAGAFAQADARQLALSIASVHLLPFAAPGPSSAFLEAPLFSAEAAAARKRAVLEHVRRLCLPAPSAQR